MSGKDFQEIKSAIAGLQKGELIIKDHTMAALGLGGKPYYHKIFIITSNKIS